MTIIFIQAHGMTPHQGSGAGQAIEVLHNPSVTVAFQFVDRPFLNSKDAYILATILGHPSTTRETLERSLDVFDRVRRPLALQVQEKSRLNGQRFSFHNCGFDHLSKEELSRQLSSLSEAFTRTWEWTWTTSIDGSVHEALRMLESRSS